VGMGGGWGQVLEQYSNELENSNELESRQRIISIRAIETVREPCS
jgi:hypothetical protein